VRILTLLMLVLLMLPTFSAAAAEDGDDANNAQLILGNPSAELWRQVRQRDLLIQGTSQVKTPDANVLINVAGEAWRQYRLMSLIPKAGLALLIGLLGVVVFRLLRGKIKLANGRSGIKILRFTLNQRVAHWATAILFVLLSLTGLILLLGRKFLIPFFGAEGFGNVAWVAKLLHDYLGPAFVVALTVLFILFVRDNMPSPKIDFQWIMKGGGLFGKHASSGRYNAGEKGWFWIAALVGLVLVISGLVLDFPIFGQTRETMEFYHVVHGIAAIVMIVASFGHIYMGTAAMEGTFEVMQTGYCDSNWASEHHDLWYEEVQQGGSPSAESKQQSAEIPEKAVT
jgi:formate dehydrogenase subunit gamma